MIINRTNLDLLTTGYKATFQQALTGSGSTLVYPRVVTSVPSSTKTESYAWLRQLPNIREWAGDRFIRNIEAEAYKIENRSWEMTIEVDRDDIEDDTYGVYSPMMAQMGETARVFPEKLVWETLPLGFTTNAFDGQFFFDTDHPVVLSDGTVGSYSNFGGGAGTAWYLMDLSKPIKPMIPSDAEGIPVRRQGRSELVRCRLHAQEVPVWHGWAHGCGVCVPSAGLCLAADAGCHEFQGRVDGDAQLQG